ncbi:hypothetical protein KC357_g172 [Hortaea werneckii]|nr:hypothetical protein KC357_g172 [Hortaea werneckii]
MLDQTATGVAAVEVNDFVLWNVSSLASLSTCQTTTNKPPEDRILASFAASPSQRLSTNRLPSGSNTQSYRTQNCPIVVNPVQLLVH